MATATGSKATTVADMKQFPGRSAETAINALKPAPAPAAPAPHKKVMTRVDQGQLLRLGAWVAANREAVESATVLGGAQLASAALGFAIAPNTYRSVVHHHGFRTLRMGPVQAETTAAMAAELARLRAATIRIHAELSRFMADFGQSAAPIDL